MDGHSEKSTSTILEGNATRSEHADTTITTCSNWMDYLKAHGLANAFLAKGITEERQKFVFDIENSWYKGCHPLSFNEHCALIAKHRQLIDEFRVKTDKNFQSLKSKSLLINEDDVFNPENLALAEEFSNDIFALSKTCTDDFVQLSSCIFGSSVEIIGGSPPCSFAVIGLGSVARGEATPYSDLEYAFIIESEVHVDYFKKLAVDSYFRIGNMMETPLKCFGLSDILISTMMIGYGYRIDGISADAGNIPTGNSDAGADLIFTVDSFIEAYKAAVLSPPGRLTGDLSDLLASTVLLYSHEGGEELYQKARSERLKYETEQLRYNSFVAEKRFNTMSKDLKKYRFLPSFDFVLFSDLSVVKVKTDIFRYPTLLAANLKTFLTLDSARPWETFRILKEQSMLSEENCRYMIIVLALSIYIRTSAYLHQNTQSEQISVYSSNASLPCDNVSDRYLIPRNLFVTLGSLLIPIKKSISSLISKGSQASSDVESMDSVASVKALLLGIKVPKSDFMLKAEVYHFLGEYTTALNILQCSVSESVMSNCDQFIEAIRQKYGTVELCDTELQYLSICIFLLYKCAKYPLAIEYLNKLLAMLLRLHGQQANNVEIAGIHNNLAKAYFALGKYSKAIEQYEISLRMWLVLHGVASNHTNIAICYSNMGGTYLNMGNLTEALNYYTKSLNMNKALHGEHANHIHLARCYRSLGKVYVALSQYKEALECQKKSYEMSKAIYSEKVSHSDIAKCLEELGNVCYKAGTTTEAISWFTQCHDMRQHLYRHNPSHPELASSCHNLGTIYLKVADYSKSLEYFTQALEILKVTYGAETNHADISDCYNSIASVYFQRSDYSKSLEFYEKAVDMLKAVHGEDCNHPAIAAQYGNIANAYNKLNKHKNAIEYYTKSLNIKRALYGEDSNHSSIATTHNNLGVLCQLSEDYQASLEHFHKTIDILLAVHIDNPNQPEIAACYNNTAYVSSLVGNYCQSQEYYNKALEMQKAIHGANASHPEIAVTYNNLGNLSHFTKKYSEALE